MFVLEAFLMRSDKNEYNALENVNVGRISIVLKSRTHHTYPNFVIKKYIDSLLRV